MSTITNNPRAFHDYFVEERHEAGLVLEGWEVKAIRAGRVTVKEAYVVVRNGGLAIIGMNVAPLLTASTHVHPDPVRTRTLLLHAKEIGKLISQVERSGYTLVPLNLHFSRGRIKAEIGLAKGKQQHDKRATEKQRDWNREKAQIMRTQAKTVAADRG